MGSRLALVATGLCWCASLLAAERLVSIPAQPLGSALLALSRHFDVQVIYLPEEVSGRQSTGVQGDLVFEQALIQLLGDSGLRFRYVDTRTVTLVAPGSSPALAPAEPSRRTEGNADVAPTAGSVRRDGMAPDTPAILVSQEAAKPDAPLMELRITGSRLARDGLSAPTPVLTMHREQLLAAAPLPIADALNQLPEFKNSQTPASTGIGTTGNAGQSFLNLRSLGIERTLVLLNGRRVVPSTANGTLDISVLPESLVERVDVVTGGASAVYGSDAVAGIVNFVLDTDFTGLEAQAQTGQSDRGDSLHQRMALTAGRSLLDGRAHVIGSASLYSNEGVKFNADRDWFRSCSRIVNPALLPNQVVACDVHSAQFTRGGLITAGPLRGTEFSPGGMPLPFRYGALASDSSMVGGSGEDHALGYQLVPETRRRNAYLHAHFELTPQLKLYSEVFLGSALAEYHSTAPWQGQTTGFTLYSDNAFLPQSLRDHMRAAGIESFPLSRYDQDFGALQVEGRNVTRRAVVGFDAQLGRWKIDAYYAAGVNEYRQTIANNVNVNRIYNAVDAVVDPATGTVVCRSTLTHSGNGCVPLNVLGAGSPSPGALAYILGTSRQDLRVEQQVFEASITGDLFAVPAGRAGFAFGVGWRKERSRQFADAISQSPRVFTGGYRGWPESVAFSGQVGGWERNNPLPLGGDYDVTEAFTETIVPLLRDAPAARLLQFNAAARGTNYSTSGGVITWKAGFIYQPMDALRLRATRSHDIRAPSITELYRGAVNGVGVINDPFQPVDSPYRRPFVLGSSYGNSDLQPERGDTRAIGLVFVPSSLAGFSASIDYFDINLQGGITTLGGQRTIDQCFAGTSFLCENLTRDSRGVLVATRSPFLNLVSRQTHGVDMDVAWQFDNGLALRLLATRTGKLTTATPGATLLDEAGQNGTGGVPRWSAKLSLAYDAGPGSVYLQQRYLSSGKLDNALGPSSLAPEENRVASAFYTDASFVLKWGVVGGELELTGNVTNLFDRDPPAAPGGYFVFGTSATNPSLYDVIGRAWSMKLRYRLH